MANAAQAIEGTANMTEQRRKEQKRKEQSERKLKESPACGKLTFQQEKVENSVGNRASRGIYIPDKRLLWTCPYYKWDDIKTAWSN